MSTDTYCLLGGMQNEIIPPTPGRLLATMGDDVREKGFERELSGMQNQHSKIQARG